MELKANIEKQQQHQHQQQQQQVKQLFN